MPGTPGESPRGTNPRQTGCWRVALEAQQRFLDLQRRSHNKATPPAPAQTPAQVELDAPNEGPPAVVAWLLPASGEGQEMLPCHGSAFGGRGTAAGPPARPSGPPPTSHLSRIRLPMTLSGNLGHHGGVVNSWLGLKKEKKNWQTLFSKR